MRLSAILIAVGGIGMSGLLGGCYEMYPGQGITHEYRSYVPPSAKSVGTGAGSVSYIATEPGTVYLIDHNRSDKLNDNKHYAPHVIGSYRLIKGQAVTVDGAAQTIVVGATGITSATEFKNPNLTAENSYELRLEPQPLD